MRFRIKGVKTGKKPIHHPAVWGAWRNFAQKPSASPKKWLEVDWMELYDDIPSWKSLTIAQDKGVKGANRKQFVIDDRNLSAANNWQTIGFEFTKNFIKFWRYRGGRWVADSKTIFIEPNGTNVTVFQSSNKRRSINTKNADRNLFWILSNVFFRKKGTAGHVNDDVYLDIDHFLYYPAKGNPRTAKNLATAADELEAVNDFSVFPNPVNGGPLTVLTGKYSSGGTLSVVDLTGKVLNTQIINEGVESITINTDLITPQSGIYLIKLENAVNSSTTKFIKQ